MSILGGLVADPARACPITMTRYSSAPGVTVGTKKPLTASGIYHAWRDRQEQAKIGPYKFHEIRHSHITHSMDNGIPIHHVSRQAGHSSADITLRIYTHSKDPERKRAYSDKNPDDALET